MKTCPPEKSEELYREAVRRSGSEAILEYPVEVAGTSIVLCKLSPDEWRTAVNENARGGAESKTARHVSVARARLWPEQAEVSEACGNVPGLLDELWGCIERLHGASPAYLKTFDVTPSLNNAALEQMLEASPGTAAQLREKFPHNGQLKVAIYNDVELEMSWRAVLHLPTTVAYEQIVEGLQERGHETVVTLAVNSIAWPQDASSWLNQPNKKPVAFALFPTLYLWAKNVAKARPTVWRRKSQTSATSTAPGTSSPKFLGTSGSSDQRQPAPPGS